MTEQTPAMPEGMKPWAGGYRAPADWDGGPVLLRDGGRGVGNRWDHDPRCKGGMRDIIAYTPRPTPVIGGSQAGRVEVTQADREAAADYCKGQWFAENFKAGRDDSYALIQAFARHHLATSPDNRHAESGAGEAYKLPCDVHLPECTIIKAGCTLATLKVLMEADCLPTHFSGNPRTAVSHTVAPVPPVRDGAEVEKLREALEKIVALAARWDTTTDGLAAASIARAALQASQRGEGE